MTHVELSRPSAMEVSSDPWAFTISDELVASVLNDPSFGSAVLASSGHAESCWGGLLQGSAERCEPGFVPQASHFKNKLCARCRSEGIIVPGDRIGAMEPAHVAAKVTNSRGSGIWSPMAGSGDNQCRVVNNTAKCSGPCLLSELLQDPNPRLLQPADNCSFESLFWQSTATPLTRQSVPRGHRCRAIG